MKAIDSTTRLPASLFWATLQRGERADTSRQISPSISRETERHRASESARARGAPARGRLRKSVHKTRSVPVPCDLELAPRTRAHHARAAVATSSRGQMSVSGRSGHPRNDLASQRCPPPQASARPLDTPSLNREALGDHKEPVFKCGPDCFAHELAATWLEKQQLGLRVHRKTFGANWRRSRIFSPMRVPPGSRVMSTATPACSRRDASRCTCVDFPQPSEPSNVINAPRDIRASVKHWSAVVESKAAL